MSTWHLVPLEYTSEQLAAAYAYAKRALPKARERDVKALAFDICGGYRAMVLALPEAKTVADWAQYVAHKGAASSIHSEAV